MSRRSEMVDMFSGVAAPASKVVEEAQRIWNEFAVLHKWRESKVLDKTLQGSIKRAVGDYGGLAGWKDALAKVAKNRFVQGKVSPKPGYKQFKANIVWFCRPQTVRNVIEDFYEDEGADGAAGSSAPALRASQDWRGRLERYRRGGFWHPSSDGPRPEDPGPHLAPAEMIEAWRKRHGIVEKAAPAAETRETRLAASIVSYRRLGHYDRANAIENELAALENRPPVFVPAPEVARHGMPPRAEKPPQRASNMGHNRPPGPITDVDEEPPAWDMVPEGDEAQAEP